MACFPVRFDYSDLNRRYPCSAASLLGRHDFTLSLNSQTDSEDVGPCLSRDVQGGASARGRCRGTIIRHAREEAERVHSACVLRSFSRIRKKMIQGCIQGVAEVKARRLTTPID